MFLPIQVYRSVVLGISMGLCNCHHYLLAERVRHSKKEPRTHWQLQRSSPRPPAPGNNSSNFCLWGPSCSGDAMSMTPQYVALCLPHVTLHNISRLLHTIDSVIPSASYGGIRFHGVDRPRYTYPFFKWWKVVCFHFEAIVNNVAMNILFQIFMCTCVSISLGYTPMSGFVWVIGNCISNILRDFQTVF